MILFFQKTATFTKFMKYSSIYFRSVSPIKKLKANKKSQFNSLLKCHAYKSQLLKVFNSYIN